MKMFKLHIGMICAAGLGTRVRGILGPKSKEMVEVLGKPALQHHLDMMLKLRGFNDVVVITNSDKRDIIEHMFHTFHRPEYRQLIQNTNVVSHVVFDYVECPPIILYDARTMDGTARCDREVSIRRKKVRVHLVVLNKDKITTNPLDSLMAAYETLGRGDFFGASAFISFPDIVFDGMLELMPQLINEVPHGLNYVSALPKESKQDTIRIERCGRFKLDIAGKDITDQHVRNLTSALSGVGNSDSCTHAELGFYYGSTRTLFRTQGTWIYDRMITSLLPIHPLPINPNAHVFDLGDPETYLRDWEFRGQSLKHVTLEQVVLP